MQAIKQRLGAVQIHQRFGLAVMTFAAILPGGLSAVGNGDDAALAAFVGFPLVLLGAIAWRGSKSASGMKPEVRRVLRQKQAIVFAFFALLFSVVVSDWPRNVAIYGSVVLNRDAFEELSVRWSKDAPFGPTAPCYLSQDTASTADQPEAAPRLLHNADLYTSVRIGLVKVVCAQTGDNNEICLYDEQREEKSWYRWPSHQNSENCVYAVHPDTQAYYFHRCVYRTVVPHIR